MLSKIPKNLAPHLNIQNINLYLNTGDLTHARRLFDKIPEPGLQLWTVLISAYTKNGQPKEAIQVYQETKKVKRVHPDKLALLAVAKACANAGDLAKAKEVHSDAVHYGFSSDLLLGNALIDMYGKCKHVEGAESVFRDMTIKDVISWTSFCSCYANCGLPRQALLSFRQMGLDGVWPNAMTLSTVLPACSNLKDLTLGRVIHGFSIKNGMGDNMFVSSALVNMYANCSSIKNAELVFCSMPQPDIVSWNVMISAYFSNGESRKALGVFQEMRNQRFRVNRTSWNSVISGCVDNGKAHVALELLSEMQQLGFKPNQITVTSVLTASTQLESWMAGKEIHGYAIRTLLSEDLAVSTALVLMYGKSGDLEVSYRLFSIVPVKDTVAWNTVIIVSSMHGRGEKAVSLFNEMVSSGVKPNSVTFIGVLSGCSHSKIVDEGQSIFNSMIKDHKIKPDVEHYSCMVDVLSRAGRLAEAYEFIQEMPMEPTAAAWGALLGACRVHKNIHLGRIAANRLFEIEPENAGNYVLFFNTLVSAKLWGEASQIRRVMRDKGIRKVPGYSWIRVKNRVHTFAVGDKRNDQSNEIYEFLDEVREKMKLDGYHPLSEFVLQDLDAEEQEDSLCNHSEKLAVAFGILNLRGESCIKVFKNLRICGDCHVTIKFIAKFAGVQIIVRDSLRFHHFKDGICSCGEFW